MPDELVGHFDSQNIRRVTQKGVTYFSLVDICAVFAESETDAKYYWRDTKKRLEQDGFEVSRETRQLKLLSKDGKMRQTDVADKETCLRIVQSIPSPKAEWVREWLAKVGIERLEEIANPGLGVQRAHDRAKNAYLRRGRDESWINERFKGIEDRQLFTQALKEHVTDIIDRHYAIASNITYEALWGRTAGDLKRELHLGPKERLRDEMTTLGLRYQGIAESAIAQKIGHAQKIEWSTALEIIHAISDMVAKQVDDMSTLLGIDLATGNPLIKDGSDE